MAILTVTRLSNVPVAGKLTLRQAIAEASNGDTIVFAADLHGSVDLAKNLVISKSITINGGQGDTFGIGGITIGGIGASVIIAAGADVTLQNVQIVGGASGPRGKRKAPMAPTGIKDRPAIPAASAIPAKTAARRRRRDFSARRR